MLDLKGTLNIINFEAGEMVQWLRALAILPEDLGSISSTYVAATTVRTSNSREFDTFIPNVHQIKLNKLPLKKELSI